MQTSCFCVDTSLARGRLASTFQESAAKDALIVLGGVDDALNLRAICERMVKDQVLFKMPNSPHPERREFVGFMRCAEMRRLSKFTKGVTRLGKEPTGRVQTGILTNVGEVPNQIAPSGRPYSYLGHGCLSFLPGLPQS